MHLLFICTENRLRSLTAEAVFSEYPGVEALSAGTNAGITKDQAISILGERVVNHSPIPVGIECAEILCRGTVKMLERSCNGINMTAGAGIFERLYLM
jgi:hypothetical protein